MVTHRYWRMTPPFALTTALFILVPTLGSGPMWWEVLGTPSENCRLHWWSNLLYFSNYMSYTKMCMLHSWFLSLNMQYFIIGIPLALMLFRKAKQNLNMVYYQPFTHFGPFAVGLCLGYILSVKKAPRFGTATLVAGWLTSLSMLGASLFAPYPFRKGDAFSPVFSAVYAGCHRTLWTLGVAWLTLLCSSNQAVQFFNHQVFKAKNCLKNVYDIFLRLSFSHCLKYQSFIFVILKYQCEPKLF
ncbi:unnamed protein product [Ixodes pacificus]